MPTTKLTRDQISANIKARNDLCSMNAQDLLSRLLRGECANQPPLGKLAVAHVILNRAKIGGWYGKGISGVNGVIMKPWQFSCFNEDNPRLPILANETPPEACTHIAELVLNANTKDPTFGATFYYAPKAMIPPGTEPKWVKDGSTILTVVIADHRFYKAKLV